MQLSVCHISGGKELDLSYWPEQRFTQTFRLETRLETASFDCFKWEEIWNLKQISPRSDGKFRKFKIPFCLQRVWLPSRKSLQGTQIRRSPFSTRAFLQTPPEPLLLSFRIFAIIQICDSESPSFPVNSSALKEFLFRLSSALKFRQTKWQFSISIFGVSNLDKEWSSSEWTFDGFAGRSAS